MSRCCSWIAIAAGLAVATVSLSAQKTTEVHPGKAGTPHVKSEWTIDGAALSLTYGRVQLKGRTPGKDVDPYDGREWRVGADEATTLVTDKPLKFGSLAVPAGTYTLYTIQTGGKWELIISKKTGQWGVPYPKGEDLGRVPMTASTSPAPVQQLTLTLQDTPAGGALRVDWGTISAIVPFTIG